MNFIIWIPLFGLWFALLFPKSRRKEKSFQYSVVIHFVWFMYFVVSSASILLVNWVVPYFLGSLGEVVFFIHTVLILTGYLMLMTIGLGSGSKVSGVETVLWGEQLMARWFERSVLLKEIQNKLFPS